MGCWARSSRPEGAMDFGVIGGTGLYEFGEGGDRLEVMTPYGPVEVARSD